MRARRAPPSSATATAVATAQSARSGCTSIASSADVSSSIGSACRPQYSTSRRTQPRSRANVSARSRRPSSTRMRKTQRGTTSREAAKAKSYASCDPYTHVCHSRTGFDQFTGAHAAKVAAAARAPAAACSRHGPYARAPSSVCTARSTRLRRSAAAPTRRLVSVDGAIAAARW